MCQLTLVLSDPFTYGILIPNLQRFMQEKHCLQMSNKKLRYHLTYLEYRSFKLEPIVSPLARDRLLSYTCRVETKGREL